MTSVLTKEEADRGPIRQLKASRTTVYDKIRDSMNNLSDVELRQMQLETEREYQIGETRSKFDEEFASIDEDVASGMKELEESWQSLNEINLPLEFQAELEKLMKETDAIVAKKLEFIQQLENEVRTRDHEYVNKTADYRKMIDTFVHTMRQQESDLKEAMAAEMTKIQTSYEQERSTTLIQVQKEVKQLAAKRQEREQTLMKQTLQNEIDQRDHLEQLRQDYAQEYMTVRTSFETRLEAAQKEYEDRLAQFNFSKEQLEYDYRILQENEDEHQEKVKMQQKKMVRQRDCLRSLIRRYEEDEARFQKQNADITKDYKRIAQSYRELQVRFRNVAYNDFNAFREVWNLNERRLHEMVLKILDADRVVMEQQLGKEPKPIDPEYLKRWIIGTEEFEDLTKTPEAPQPISQADDAIKKGKSLFGAAALSEPLEHLRRMVTDEAGFLVDEKVRGILGKEPDEADSNQKETIRLDVLLQELGITEPEDVEQLLSHFIKDTEFGELETPGFVKPHEVLEGLRNFVEAFHPNKQQNQMTLFTQISRDATQNTSSEVARAILQLQGKMKKQMIPQRQFYQKKGEIVTERMWRLWNACFKGMQRYVQELEERAKLINETERLRTQNAELEQLLSQYLESDNNDQLIYSPEETVDFQAFD